MSHFEQYLAGAKNIPAGRRAEVKQQIARLAVKASKLVVESPVPGAKVLVDGTVVGTTPLDKTLTIDPGVHRVVVSRTGYDDFALDITAPAAETYRLSAKLVKPRPTTGTLETPEPRRTGEGPVVATPPPVRDPPPVVSPAPTQPPLAIAPTTAPAQPRVSPPRELQPRVALVPQSDTERPHEGKLSKAWFWTGAGTTAALAATTIVVGSVALSRSNEYNDPTTAPMRKQELLDSGPGMAHAADALLFTTLAAAGVTVWLYFKTDWGVTATPNGAAVAGRF
jgi:hypothetical protein